VIENDQVWVLFDMRRSTREGLTYPEPGSKSGGLMISSDFNLQRDSGHLERANSDDFSSSNKIHHWMMLNL
jgi:hypothetical protein